MAIGVYQEPQAFIKDVFNNDPPQASSLWLTGNIKEKVHEIMGHGLGVLRLRYWQRDNRTAWILEEIGKEKPITTGIVVDNGEIERLKVLIYRETRGGEVRYPFFTDQFRGAQLRDDRKLNRNIDGISGATLSVNALENLARLALFLHDRVNHDKADSVARH